MTIITREPQFQWNDEWMNELQFLFPSSSDPFHSTPCYPCPWFQCNSLNASQQRATNRRWGCHETENRPKLINSRIFPPPPPPSPTNSFQVRFVFSSSSSESFRQGAIDVNKGCHCQTAASVAIPSCHPQQIHPLQLARCETISTQNKLHFPLLLFQQVAKL